MELYIRVLEGMQRDITKRVTLKAIRFKFVVTVYSCSLNAFSRYWRYCRISNKPTFHYLSTILQLRI